MGWKSKDIGSIESSGTEVRDSLVKSYSTVGRDYRIGLHYHQADREWNLPIENEERTKTRSRRPRHVRESKNLSYGHFLRYYEIMMMTAKYLDRIKLFHSSCLSR